MSFERLIAEHKRIDRTAHELLAILDGPQNVEAALPALTELAFELREHLAYEDSQIYPQLMASQCPGVAEDAQKFGAEFASLAADWTQYLVDWTAECMAADWPQFRVETIDILARLARRVQQENDLLYPHALQQGCIGLRDLRDMPRAA